jgi:endo-beta-N-acetylglucosaminidase D
MKEHEEATGEKTQTMTEKMKEFLKQASEEEKEVLSQMESDSGENNILAFDPNKRTIH